jgi:recombinational DNA repair protein RecR
VEDVADLWAMERAAVFKGRYHVLGGTLSALDAVGPEDLRIPKLLDRVASEGVTEVILALNATVDGQTTAHYIADRLGADVKVTSLAQGVPIGGELDYLDDGTISAAKHAFLNQPTEVKARRSSGSGTSARTSSCGCYGPEMPRSLRRPVEEVIVAA